MTDWYNLARNLAMVDNRVDKATTLLIKEALLADDKIDKTEFRFLISLRREADVCAPEFDDLVFKTIKKVASSAESVGQLRFGELPKSVI